MCAQLLLILEPLKPAVLVLVLVFICDFNFNLYLFYNILNSDTV